MSFGILQNTIAPVLLTFYIDAPDKIDKEIEQLTSYSPVKLFINRRFDHQKLTMGIIEYFNLKLSALATKQCNVTTVSFTEDISRWEMEHLEAIMASIPNTAKTLIFKDQEIFGDYNFNGKFEISNNKKLFTALRFASTIERLDFSYGITEKAIPFLVYKLPINIQIVQCGKLEIDLGRHRVEYAKYYEENYAYALDQKNNSFAACKALLENYCRPNFLQQLFSTRNHIRDIQNIIQQINKNEITNVREIIESLEHITPVNYNGTIARMVFFMKVHFKEELLQHYLADENTNENDIVSDLLTLRT